MYQEYQTIRSWWVRIPILISSFFCIYICLQQILFKQSLTDNTIADIFVVVIIFIIGIGNPSFVHMVRLETKIENKKLTIKFWPFHFKPVIFRIIDIKKAEAITYNAIKDYGGWGIRYGFKGKCYNVKGNLGVKVFLKNGSYILFGSQKYKELEKSLQKIIQQ